MTQTSLPPDKTVVDRDPWIGREINGKYRIVEQLGAGGMGKVYQCEHALLPGRFFALKLLHSNLTADEGVRSRFLREGEILMGLIHPSIVAVRDLGLTVEGQIYLCLDYCEGVPLRDILRRRGQLAPADALRIVAKVLDGLVVAHGAEIIHRDLKPENIMIGAGSGEELDVRLLDFGIAYLGEADGGGLTQQGVILGTPRYMSPEQAMGEPLDVRSDLYSVGLVLYEMLVGEPAIAGRTTRAILAQQRMADIEPIRNRLVGHPWSADIDALLGRVLVADPNDRLPSAVEFRETVRSILRDARPQRLKSRARQKQGIAAAVVTMVLFGGGAWALRASRTDAIGPALEAESHPDEADSRPVGSPPREPVPTVSPRGQNPQTNGRPQKPSPRAGVHLCPICGYRAAGPGICISDGVRLAPVDSRSGSND